jgi:Hypoxia induced protein conserved region
MSTFTTVIAGLALGAVAVVLIAGLGNMTRGGSPNVSQNLMRWRVILQFVAIVVLMTIVYVKSNSTG